MKLYSSSTVILGAIASANNGKVKREVGTNNPELADFPNALQAEWSDDGLDTYWPASLGLDPSHNCAYLDFNNNPASYVHPWTNRGPILSFATNCDDGNNQKLVGCEWRAGPNDPLPVSSDLNNNGLLLNGWQCTPDQSVCFSAHKRFDFNEANRMGGQTLDWWSATSTEWDGGCTHFSATVGEVNAAAPKTDAEVELLKEAVLGGSADQNGGKMWIALFHDSNSYNTYWTHGGVPTPPASSALYDTSAATQTFTDSDYIHTSPNQDAPSAVLETMMEGYGIPLSGRKKRATQWIVHRDSMINAIERTGCWCPSALTSNAAHHGTPINEYDTLCKTLSSCMRKANACACSSGNPNAGFSYAFNDNFDYNGFACKADNACDLAVCMCQVQFAYDVNLALVSGDYPMTYVVDDAVLDVNASSCPVPAGAGTGNGAGNGAGAVTC